MDRFEKEIELGVNKFYVTGTKEMRFVDDSFDHEFGTCHVGHDECIGVDIDDVFLNDENHNEGGVYLSFNADIWAKIEEELIFMFNK